MQSFSASSLLSSADNVTNRDTAIGAGAGVPLGVIALISLGWTFFERKRAHSAHEKRAAMVATKSCGMQLFSSESIYEINGKHRLPAELGQAQPPAETRIPCGGAHGEGAVGLSA